MLNIKTNAKIVNKHAKKIYMSNCILKKFSNLLLILGSLILEKDIVYFR